MIHYKRLDHILISIPVGKTDEARTFYRNVLGLTEIPGDHPKGAIWFDIADIQLHIREETPQTSSDRHPAFEITGLDEAQRHFQAFGITPSFSSEIDGRQRFFIRDPFGNRIEFLEYLNTSK
jgi:extradiol dioxygenase family protein